jgi:hypothetical protein
MIICFTAFKETNRIVAECQNSGLFKMNEICWDVILKRKPPLDVTANTQYSKGDARGITEPKDTFASKSVCVSGKAQNRNATTHDPNSSSPRTKSRQKSSFFSNKIIHKETSESPRNSWHHPCRETCKDCGTYSWNKISVVSCFIKPNKTPLDSISTVS